ncbi:hypothetical protein [Streptomyces vilmorinianum]|uniref:hypothetical protein n=1 Tax=Streptomyces vilmorinianum TaxID=3051092 RepID=UPI0010FAE150|nr:hypothetical protein [Streptomyces vilmorinianum]
MPYDRTVNPAGTFDETVEAVRRALADQGFGILTEIDVQVIVQAVDPSTMVTFTGVDAMAPVADEAARRLDAARYAPTCHPRPGRW